MDLGVNVELAYVSSLDGEDKGGVIWNFQSNKSPFVLDYCFTLRCRSFHLLTQINIHYAPRYFGISFATLTSAYAKSASSSLKFKF